MSSSSSSAFRPIAPAMDNLYAASCNPPRRAKRLRAQSVDNDDLPSPSPSQPDADDNEVPQPKRRGRKPGTLSRAAREAQRKINHSLIEKARRTKINDALATLRELVPPDYKRDDNDHDDDDDDDLDPRRPRQKPKPSGEKEFKLEILVRTVAYLQDLTEKVHRLEHASCPRCSELTAVSSAEMSPSKRPREDVSSPRSSSSSRLPSISTWLPSSADDQRPLLLTPSQSPVFDPSVTTRTTQLPTPPASATCPPSTNGFPIPPVLTLPSPSTLLPQSTTTHIQPRFSGFRANSKSSPLASPVYTPDDETAASLLLRMSATSPRASTIVRSTEPDKQLATGFALTPSRLLGLSAER